MSSAPDSIFGLSGLLFEVRKIFNDEKLQYAIKSAEGKDIVMFLGPTGAGKSLALNYLIGRKISRKKVEVIKGKPKRTVLDLAEGEEPVSYISHSQSGTLIPQFFEYKSRHYYDCPGFFDTRSLEHKIVVSKIIQALFKKAKSVRIAFFLMNAWFSRIAEKILPVFNMVKELSTSFVDADMVAFVDNEDDLLDDIEEKVAFKSQIEEIADFTFRGLRVDFWNPLNEGARDSFRQILIELKPCGIREIRIPLDQKQADDIKIYYRGEADKLNKRLRSIEGRPLEGDSIEGGGLIGELNKFIDVCDDERKISAHLETVEGAFLKIKELKKNKGDIDSYLKELSDFPTLSSVFNRNLADLKRVYQEEIKGIEELLNPDDLHKPDFIDLGPICSSYKLRVKALQQKREDEDREEDVFSRYVAKSERDRTEEILKRLPGLALRKLVILDDAKREFRMTGFQYAVWALDWRMWETIKKFLTIEEARNQYLELRLGIHGIHFDLTPLINAMDEYVNNFHHWDDGRRRYQWCRVVGGHQRTLPVNIVYEICLPGVIFTGERFVKCNEGWDIERNRRTCDGLDWYDPKLGNELAWGRGYWEQATPLHNTIGGIEPTDLAAFRCLFDCRKKQLAKMVETLDIGPALRSIKESPSS